VFNEGAETMKALIPATILTVSLLASQQTWAQPGSPTHSRSEETMDRVAAATYENLANAIIAIEATENELVKSILLGYQAAAHGHLHAAIADEKNRRAHLEEAAADIANIANEGDKRIQAIRQRLAKAGHTHNSDATTKEDYMFIDSKEKKAFLELARRVSQLNADAKPEQIRAVHDDLRAIFDKAIAAE